LVSASLFKGLHSYPTFLTYLLKSYFMSLVLTVIIIIIIIIIIIKN
jgi:hypothetical protein